MANTVTVNTREDEAITFAIPMVTTQRADESAPTGAVGFVPPGLPLVVGADSSAQGAYDIDNECKKVPEKLFF